MNQPAFPLPPYREYIRPESAEGMTLRDYFAGQALIGFCSQYGLSHAADQNATAKKCYEIADAMLTARVPKGTYSEDEFTGEPDPTDLARDYNEGVEYADQPTPYDP